jgi:hypothetical protein
MRGTKETTAMSRHRATLLCIHCGASLHVGERGKLTADEGTAKCPKSKRGHKIDDERAALDPAEDVLTA